MSAGAPSKKDQRAAAITAGGDHDASLKSKLQQAKKKVNISSKKTIKDVDEHLMALQKQLLGNTHSMQERLRLERDYDALLKRKDQV